MEIWWLIGETILLMTASFLLGEYLQRRRECNDSQQPTQKRVASCVRFASTCAGQLVWMGMIESAKRSAATKALAKLAYEYNYEKAGRMIEEEISADVNELV